MIEWLTRGLFCAGLTLCLVLDAPVHKRVLLPDLLPLLARFWMRATISSADRFFQSKESASH